MAILFLLEENVKKSDMTSEYLLNSNEEDAKEFRMICAKLFYNKRLSNIGTESFIKSIRKYFNIASGEHEKIEREGIEDENQS